MSEECRVISMEKFIDTKIGYHMDKMNELYDDGDYLEAEEHRLTAEVFVSKLEFFLVTSA